MVIDLEELEKELKKLEGEEEEKKLLAPPPKKVEERATRAVYIPAVAVDEDVEPEEEFRCPYCNMANPVEDWTTSITVTAWESALYVEDGQLCSHEGAETEYDEAEFFGIVCPHCARTCDLPKGITR